MKKPSVKQFSLAICIFTFLLAVVRSVLLLAFYDSDVGYLHTGMPSVLLAILYALGLFLCATPLILVREKIQTTDLGNFAFRLRLPATICFFLCGILMTRKGAIYHINLEKACGFLCIISALYFIFSSLSELPKFRGRFNVARPWLGIILLATLMCLLSSAYFDMTVNINGPFTAVFLFSLLSCATFFLCEIRMDIGRPAQRLHYVISLVAFLLTGSSSVSNLLFCLFGDPGVGKTISDPTRPILLLSLSLVILTRLLSFSEDTQQK